MTVFHYSRVSTDEQTTENQILAAKTAGYTVDRWYADSGVSGAMPAIQRPEFSKLLAEAKQEDVLIVSSVDRIGRNTVDVLNTVDLCQSKGVRVCVLAYGNLDITSEMGRVVLTMAATFAELERSYLRTRTKAGMKRVVAQGTKLGAPLKITPEDMETILKDKKSGITLEDISKKYSIHRNTLRNNLEKWEDNLKGYKKEYVARQEQYERKKALLLASVS